MKLVDEPLIHHVNLITTAEQKNFFDLLHFSPLKVHTYINEFNIFCMISSIIKNKLIDFIFCRYT